MNTAPPEAGYVLLEKDRVDDRLLFLATEKNLYRTSDQGDRWEPIFHLAGKEGILSIRSDRDRLFLVTRNEIYASGNNGKDWRRILLPVGAGSVTTFEIHPEDPEVLFLGTAHGLFWSLDGGESWTRQSGHLGQRPTRCIFIHPEELRFLFVATDKDLYRSDNFGRSFSKSLHLDPGNTGEDGVDEGFSSSGAEPVENSGFSNSGGIRVIRSFPGNPDEILAGTVQGIFMSYTAGRSWLPLPKSGLASPEILDIRISASNGVIFALTPAGVYGFERYRQRWKALHEGMAERSVRGLEMITGETESLLALSRDNLLRWQNEWLPPGEMPSPEYRTFSEVPGKDLLDLFSREPTVRDVQQAAIRYNDVGNGKIKRWHAASRLKALVPDVSFNKYISNHNTIDLDRRGTNEPDFYILGPDATSISNSLNFGWDLKDLVWSTDQTSIDSREKLMVELREDIVGEITRLYFERRRLLMEFFLNRPSEHKEYLESLLRIEELTAYLDGLTGGYLTKELVKRGIQYA